MNKPYVHELFLRHRYPGWRVSDTNIHIGRRCFIEETDDGIDISQHGAYVFAAEHEAWLRAGHDPGDEDARER